MHCMQLLVLPTSKQEKMKELKLEEEEQRRKDLLEGKLFWGGKMWIDDDPTELLDPNAMGSWCPPKVVDAPTVLP